MKILIVDDSRAMQTIVRRGIERLGYKHLLLKQAGNGIEALDIIRVWEPDFVISDWHMPEMNGIDLLHAINREMLGIHIGFVTTESSEERLEEARQAGAKFIVQKPFDTNTLHEALLPIIQGSIDGEEALKRNQEAEEKTSSEHISLPTLQELSARLNSLTGHSIQLQKTVPISLNRLKFPYLLGLYGDKEKQSVHAIAIADNNATCILGALQNNISEEDVHISLADKVLSKSIMDDSKLTFQNLETLLTNTLKKETLRLRSTNVMRKENPNINKLLTASGHRLDVTISLKDYGVGHLTLIVS
jgi:CheY-like chemotaxis protein